MEKKELRDKALIAENILCAMLSNNGTFGDYAGLVKFSFDIAKEFIKQRDESSEK